MADKSYISKIQLPSGTEPYWLKDLEARTMINALSSIVSGSLVVCGETTTQLADGSTVNPVKVKYNVTIRGVDYTAGSDYTAVAGDTFFYNSKEFVFDGTNWIEFGDITGLGNLAFADQASASYTPSGTVSTPVISLASGGGTTIVKNLSVESVVQSATQGTLPALGMTVGGDEGETLSISWGAGTLPTFTSTYTQNVTAVSSVPSYSSSQPAFTGISAIITSNPVPKS